MSLEVGCFKCGRRVPCGAGIELQTGEVVDNRDGDFHVCLVCGEILISDGGGWRGATLHEILSADPAAKQALAVVVRAVRAGAFIGRGAPGAGGMVN